MVSHFVEKEELNKQTNEIDVHWDMIVTCNAKAGQTYHMKAECNGLSDDIEIGFNLGRRF